MFLPFSMFFAPAGESREKLFMPLKFSDAKPAEIPACAVTPPGMLVQRRHKLKPITATVSSIVRAAMAKVAAAALPRQMQ
jgi:hypothetical protein